MALKNGMKFDDLSIEIFFRCCSTANVAVKHNCCENERNLIGSLNEKRIKPQMYYVMPLNPTSPFIVFSLIKERVLSFRHLKVMLHVKNPIANG